jgi:hypothetical protein
MTRSMTANSESLEAMQLVMTFVDSRRLLTYTFDVFRTNTSRPLTAAKANVFHSEITFIPNDELTSSAFLSTTLHANTSYPSHAAGGLNGIRRIMRWGPRRDS